MWRLLSKAAAGTGANDADVGLAVRAFIAFFCVNASDYLVLPLREEAAMQLGTNNIPKLFTASLVVILVAAPIVTHVLSRQGSSRARGHRQLFIALAFILTGFYVAFTLAPPDEQLPLAKLVLVASHSSSTATHSKQLQRQQRRHLLATGNLLHQGHLPPHVGGEWRHHDDVDGVDDDDEQDAHLVGQQEGHRQGRQQDGRRQDNSSGDVAAGSEGAEDQRGTSLGHVEVEESGEVEGSGDPAHQQQDAEDDAHGQRGRRRHRLIALEVAEGLGLEQHALAVGQQAERLGTTDERRREQAAEQGTEDGERPSLEREGLVDETGGRLDGQTQQAAASGGGAGDSAEEAAGEEDEQPNRQVGVSAAAAGEEVQGSRAPLQARHRERAGRGPSDAVGSASGLRAWVMTVFYVWDGVQNLISLSALWTLCADVFSPEAGARLFGFLTAGATAGQLAGSLLSMSFVQLTQRLISKAVGPPILLLPCAALLMVMASQCCVSIGALASGSSSSRQPGALLSAQKCASPSGKLALAVSPAVPPADVATSSAAATVTAVEVHHVHRLTAQLSPSGVKAAAKAVVAHGRDMAGHRNSSGGRDMVISSLSEHSSTSVLPVLSQPVGEPLPSPRLLMRFSVARRLSLARHYDRAVVALDGFQMIAASPFLILLCLFIMMGYMVCSVVYFERVIIVATTMTDSGQRVSFFAALNFCTAAVVLALQLLATGKLMRYLGTTATLCIEPTVTLLGVLLIALHPTTDIIAGVEVVRKVIQHALSRPTRELIFTVMSRKEKYKAKMIIDSIVHRLGNAIAAGIFQILDIELSLGPSAMALVGACICTAWLGAAWQLGQQYTCRASRQAMIRTDNRV